MGVPPSVMLLGLEDQQKNLLGKQRRMDWVPFNGFIERISKHFDHDSEKLRLLGRKMFQSSEMIRLIRMALLTIRVIDIYKMNQLFGIRSNYSIARGSYQQLSPREIKLIIKVESGYQLCPALATITTGILELFSTFFNLPEARVTLSKCGDQEIEHLVQLPADDSIWIRLKRLIASWKGTDDAYSFLCEQNEEIHASNLEASEVKRDFSELIKHSPFGMVIEKEGKIQYANPAFLESIDSPQVTDLFKISFKNLVNPEDLELCEMLLSAEHEKPLRLRFLTSSPIPVELEVSVMKLQKIGGNVSTLIVTRDVTEVRRMESQILKAENHGYKRLGRDLHDTLGQHLVGLSLRINTLKEQASQDQWIQPLAELSQLAEDATNLTRRLSRGLEHYAEIEISLGKAMEEVAEDCAKRLKLEIELKLSNSVSTRERTNITHLCSILQEALTNAVKHGNANRARVELSSKTPGLGTLEIHDDGDGKSETLLKGSKKAGLGLKSMQYRSQQVNGFWSISESPLGGICIKIQFALAESHTTGQSASNT